MQAKDIIKKKGNAIFSVCKNDKICEALKIMNRKNIGSLMVMKNEEIQGILSERDILRFFSSHDCNDCAEIEKRGSERVEVAEIMTGYDNLIFASATCEVHVLMDKMTNNNIRHIPVLDGKKLLGMISMRDVVSALLFVAKREKDILEDYITSAY